MPHSLGLLRNKTLHKLCTGACRQESGQQKSSLGGNRPLCGLNGKAGARSPYLSLTLLVCFPTNNCSVKRQINSLKAFPMQCTYDQLKSVECTCQRESFEMPRHQFGCHLSRHTCLFFFASLAGPLTSERGKKKTASKIVETFVCMALHWYPS